MSSKNPHQFLSDNTAGTVVSMQASKIATTVGGSVAGKIAGAVVSHQRYGLLIIRKTGQYLV